MSRLIIADGFCPRPYSDQSLQSEAMGGTESAVVLLAEALSNDYEVTVFQHCRKADYVSSRGVTYKGTANWRTTASTTLRSQVIVINSPKLLGIWARGQRHSGLYLWRHNFLGNRHRSISETLQHCDATMVCVSRYQRNHALRLGSAGSYACSPEDTSLNQRTTVIPNPVLIQVPDKHNKNFDPDQLIFCSSPHKGLEQVLSYFVKARQAIPTLKLLIANPGYMHDKLIEERGVCVTGALSRVQLHTRISSSLCVFYPQSSFLETFCLVAAEANALGTPILAPSIGALPEVTSPPTQLLPVLSINEIIEKLHHWRTGSRPKTILKGDFSVDQVAHQWRKLLTQGERTEITKVKQALVV